MVDLTQPSFLTPTITVKGDVVVGKTLRVGPPVAGTGDGGGPSVVVGYPEKFQINGIGVQGLTQFASEVYNGQTYKVYRGLDLQTLFVNTIGRQPTTSEDIVFTIPADVAIVGDDLTKSGLLIPLALSTVKSISVVTAGLIMGKGGDGASWVNEVEGKGGDGINNLTSIKVNVTNYGGIVGGGGGGGRNNQPFRPAVGGGGAVPRAAEPVDARVRELRQP